jgi:hypothetical protein
VTKEEIVQIGMDAYAQSQNLRSDLPDISRAIFEGVAMMILYAGMVWADEDVELLRMATDHIRSTNE